MSSWERLEDQDNLLADDTSSGGPCIQNSCSGKRRRFNIIALSILAITFVLTIVLVSTLNRNLVTKLVESPGLQTTTPFMDPFPEDSNSSESGLSWKSFDPPEFSPTFAYVEEILALFTPTNDTTTNSTSAINPVQVIVFYEVLNRPSRDFLVHQFFPTYAKLSAYMSPIFVPYGNANLTKDGTFSCENGFDECQGNLVHACAIETMTPEAANNSESKGKLIAYLGCMMGDMEILNPQADMIGKECAKFVKIDWDTIYNCTQNGKGMEVIRRYQELTDVILPVRTHLKLPLMIVKHILHANESAYSNFLRYMCTEVLESPPSVCETT